MVKVIQIEPFIKKREALVIEEYSRKGDIERLNKESRIKKVRTE